MPYRPSPQIADALISERFQIRAVIQNAVDTSFHMAFRALSGRAGEVEKLIYFFMEGLPILETGVSRLLRPYNVSVVVSGIFCHQTPKVRSTRPLQSSASCELGDIAFLSTYESLPASSGMGNAILMQAKEHFHPGAYADQEMLYESAEEFEYTSPSELASKTRSLTNAKGCLYYWDFDDWRRPFPPRPSSPTFAILARPKDPSGRHFQEPFENILTDMFCGIAGRGFQGASSAANGWTEIIHDLVRTSASRSIHHRRVFATRTGQLPKRLHNYCADLIDNPQTSLVRCSLAGFLTRIDRDLSEIGDRLEAEARDYQWHEGEIRRRRDIPDEGIPPPMNRGDSSDGGSGGGSFVVFQFKSGR